jgi:carboxypeptidase family protein
VNRPSFCPVAPGWLIGCALLLGAVAGPSLATGSISGKVTVPSGFEVSMETARVNAADANFHDSRVTPDADGSYQLTDLEPGKYTLAVVAKGLEPIVMRDVEVKDGAEVKQDFAMEAAKPFPIVYSPKPIPLDSDYNSADFADAPEMHADEAWQIRNGALDGWTGPSEVSAKFKMKYSDVALHLAGDVSFKAVGVNNADRAGNQLWNGNSIEFFWQNDPLDIKREEYDLDHNWQIVVTLADNPEWILYQRGQDSRPVQKLEGHLKRVIKADNSGELVRWDMPFAVFLQTGAKTGAISAPALDSLGALDITINAADPDADRTEAVLKSGIDWGGFSDIWNNPSFLRPIKFVAQAQ